MDSAYAASRAGTALYDLGAEGRFRISGPACVPALDALVSVDLGRIDLYRGAEALLTRADGGLVAMAIIFKGRDEFYLFTEAETADTLHRHLAAAFAGQAVAIDDLRATHGLLAVVGPAARDAMVEAAGDDVLALRLFSFEHDAALGAMLFRTASTGEFEFRLLVPADGLESLQARLTAAGAAFGMVAGDDAVWATLMLEVRSLRRCDIPPEANVLEAGLHWMIDFAKPDLMAGGVLNSLKHSLRRRGLMLALGEAGKARAGDTLSIDGEPTGVIARVAYSPTLRQDIALGYVDADIAWVGVALDVAGRETTTARGISAPVLLTQSILTS